MSVLVATRREGTGKSVARRLRREGTIPAVIYGQNDRMETVAVNSHDLSLLLKTGHTVVDLEVEGKQQQAVIREIQYHPVSGKFLHVDFMRIASGHELSVSVPIHYVGKPAGVAVGGILTTEKNELEIMVLPKYIPDFIDVDISPLEVGMSLRVKDVKVENMKLLDDMEDILCHVSMVRGAAEEEEAVEGIIEEAEEAEPEVITARRKEEPEE